MIHQIVEILVVMRPRSQRLLVVVDAEVARAVENTPTPLKELNRRPVPHLHLCLKLVQMVGLVLHIQVEVMGTVATEVVATEAEVMVADSEDIEFIYTLTMP